MGQITFEIDNSNDLQLLINIAEKLGIKKFFITNREKTKSSKNKKLLQIIEKGVDISNFGNIEEWLRNERKDRSINLENT
jgi:ribosome-binding protein aMBF1 (putative translation factor)